jgi:hypothetical protein
MRQFLVTAAIFLPCLANSARAEPIDVPSLPTPSEAELARILREMLLARIPDPLYHAEPGWGKQVPALIDHNKMRNEGVWRKLRATANNPAQSLIVEVRNVKEPAPAKMTFDLLVALDVWLDFEQQIWERGIRIYSGSSKARSKVWTALAIEVTTRFDGKGLLPDLIVHIHVTKADVRYSKFELIHTAGIGGDGAKLLGEAMQGLLKDLHPSLEKEMLQKADAAIIKAGDSKEVRISLGKLLKLGGQ